MSGNNGDSTSLVVPESLASMKIAAILRLKHAGMLLARGTKTQKEAAAEAGIGHNVWCAVENLRFNNVGLGTLQKIADWGRVTADDWFPAQFRDLAGVTFTSLGDMDQDQLEAMSGRRCLPGSASRSAELAEARDSINVALRTLTYRQREVIKRRFGLNGGRAQTYGEIGKAVGVTAERVRQTEREALCKLGDPARGRRLESHL